MAHGLKTRPYSHLGLIYYGQILPGDLQELPHIMEPSAVSASMQFENCFEPRTYRSLPKKGSVTPLLLVTTNQGQPNAPASRATLVLSNSFCLYLGLFAPSTISLTCSGEKFRKRVFFMISGFSKFICSFHIAIHSSANAASNLSRG